MRLYEEKRANLIRFFAGRLRSMAEADDLIQDLYLKVSALERNEPGQQVSSALLYRMAENLMIDRLRSRARAAARDEHWRRDHTTLMDGVPTSEEPNADDVVAGRQRFAQLTRAVATLPPQTRRAFQLHKLEGWSHADTATAMGMSTSAVEKHISAAMKALRKKLK